MPINQALKKNSHVLWSISLIQDITPDAQTKDEFVNMLDDILATDTIDKVTLLIADHLQRFRFMIEDNCSEQEAIAKCDQMAKTWHADNAQSLEKLKANKNLSFLTWDEFLKWPEYEKTVKSVETWYKENAKFKHDVDGRILQELKKIKVDAKITDPTKQTELLKKYLFEEYAFQKFASFKRFNYELYKNPMPPAMRRIKANSEFVPPGFMTELHFTQFNSPPKKTNFIPVNRSNFNSLANVPMGLDFPTNFAELPNFNAKSSFGSVFNNHQIANEGKEPKHSNGFKSCEQRRAEVSEFIDKTLKLLPEKEQENAMATLVKFMTQEIIPLYYNGSHSSLKTQ